MPAACRESVLMQATEDRKQNIRLISTKQRKTDEYSVMEEKCMLEAGTKAPDFTLPDQDGNEVSLHDFRGKKVILYFYPKDNTSGCTKQACAYRDLFPQISEKGAVVLGISKDTVRSHKNFKEKYDLPFTLLADPDRKVLEEYDVLKEKTMYGKKVMGTVRTTYLIDENGNIEKAYEKVKPESDPEVLLSDIMVSQEQS